ncbi:pre-mRNA-processing factor 39 isoform X1 [Drosophila albomicans]|uniref:Pre-mRNA-processing factor 39 n=1 Tax=Drosophila albomicans TaxID=7291 RepID=A0A6P8XI01_DROAB|nr:pre-mRNA-processing factor 39 isoform X1 [Drosophila albomicans]
MASEQDENVVIENSGRRTRSGRPVAVPIAATPTRTTRRTSKRQAQLSDHEEENEIVLPPTLAQPADDEEPTMENNAEAQHYEQQLDDDVEMLATIETTTGGVDEKSSSFPFGAVAEQHSETSDDIKESRTEDGVDTSLLASLAGDNANSLPSVAGNDEADINKKSDFESNVSAMESKLNSSEDSSSHHAIAESLGDDLDASNATIVNTEIISEDELPPPSKPEINDAEEVSDEELPAPQRAELPADAEVISEDELPTHNNNNNGAEPKVGSKRKADKDEDSSQSKIDEDDGEQSSEQQTSTKSKATEQYNPSSPTSESNDAPPSEKRAKIDEADGEQKDKEKDNKKEKERDKDKEKEKDKEKDNKEKERKKLPDLDKYWRVVKDDASDFTGWTYLLQYVDSESDAEAAREAYDTFLSHYPYCYGYWRKYADYEKRKGIKANCYKVFERGLEAIPLSVDLWIHYLMHIKAHHGDDEQFIRSQYERAVQACGLEFRSDKLWDAYIRWENESKRYQRVVQIYDRLLSIPTQGYNGHFDNFQDLINQHTVTATISNEELLRLRKEWHERQHSKASKSSSKSRRDSGSSKEAKGERERDRDRDESKQKDGDSKSPKEASEAHTDESSNVTDLTSESSSPASSKLPPPTDFSDLSTLTDEEIGGIKERVISARRKVHKSTVSAVTARWSFEEGIKRPYFHVKPLERAQLKNWKDYLDFEIEKGDRERILVLFERCLIACALYDEFWLKMLRYLESLSDQSPEVLQITREVYRRACCIHHTDKPSLHLMWAAFEELQRNFDGAAEVLERIEQRCPHLLQIAYRRINVERRRGALDKCRELYKHYIDNSKNKAIAGSLSIKYARFLNKICNDLEAGLAALQQALERDPANTRVALQMIDLCLQRPQVVETEVVQIMDKFMARADIEPDQKVLFAQRKVEFLEDFGSTAKGLQDAQRALQQALNKANEAQKKGDGSPSRKASTNSKDGAAASAGSAATTAYNNGGTAAANASYNYNSANSSAYYSQQSASGAYAPQQQQQQQQQQQSYDSYYNQWGGYGSQGGAASTGGANYNYGQWSGYGNYY